MNVYRSTRWIAFAFLAITAVLWLFCSKTQEKSGTAKAESVSEAETSTSAPAGAPTSFADIAEKLQPAVANISTTSTAKGLRGLPRDFWHFFPMPPERKRQSLGSGFVIDGEGHILTNNHVVKNADKIKVQFADHISYTAEVVGTDPKTDIALIKVDPKENGDFQPAVLGDSDKLRVGDWVLAVGNPFGLSHTVTAGIVSAKGRFIGNTEYDNLIQTDASINPGNSGGPLVDIHGKVVGINSSIFTPSGGNVGIGFAIPINMAKKIVTQLKEKGKVERAWLGVLIQGIDPELAESFGLEKPEGALVAQVIEDSPADKAGLKEEDIITEVDGRKMQTHNELMRVISLSPVGKTIELTVIRDGKKKNIEVELTARPEDKELMASGRAPAGKAGSEELGIEVANVPPQMRKELGIEHGVVVTEIDPAGVAASGGIREGDVILKIKGEKVENTSDFKDYVKDLDSGDILRLQLQRGNARIFVAFRIP